MQCPKCGSAQICENSLENAQRQIICMDCRYGGTFTEFGVLEAMNLGLVKNSEDALFSVEENLSNVMDPTRAIKITIHVVDGKSVVNVWTVFYGQNLKRLPEKQFNSSPNPKMMNGVILALMMSNDFVSTDLSMSLAMSGLTLSVERLADQFDG